MPSKFDQLRGGQAVEIEPGVSGRLNPKDKTLQLSTGEVLNVANDPDFFPRDEQSKAISKQRESVEKGIKGAGGEFFHQFANQGLVGGAKDWVSYLSQTGDEYINRKQAEQQVSERISEESPYTSGAATAASFATDIAATRGMSALKAAPLLTLGSAGSRIATEPGEVLGETAMSAGLGYGLDKASGYLNRVAQRRGAIRSLPGEQEAVRNRNFLGQQATNEANALQNEQFNALTQNVKNVNETRLKQYQADLNDRQNKMIQSQNAFEQSKAARESEVVRLKNQAEVAKAQRSADASKLESEYKAAKSSAEQENKRLNDEFKLAQSQYQESLKKLPEMQKKSQAEFSANVLKNASEIERSFPKNSKISTDEFGLEQFIENGINKTGIAGSRNANQSTRILRSIFPEGEMIGGRELSKRYKALEDAIQRSTPEVQSVLNNFKQHLGKRLPTILEDSVAYNKIVPLLKRTLEGDVRTIMKEINFAGTGSAKAKDSVTQFALNNAKNILKNDLTPGNFIEKVQSGEMARELANKILTVEDFLIDVTPETLKNAKKSGLFEHVFQDAQQKHAYFVRELSNQLEKKLARYEIKAMESARTASKKLGKDVKKTYGIAEPVPVPSSPSAPQPVSIPNAPGELPALLPTQLPSPVAPPPTLPLPNKPNLMAQPTAPINQSFIPQPEPNLAPSQGFADKSGDLLEKNLMGGKGLVDNPLTKLAGLKYLFGGAALPAEAAYVGMKGLTSPTALGEAARMSFKQGGIQAIETWAQKYPSYKDGILQSPQDRRSLTKEIEDDYEIPIEQKAVIQSKVNRGKPLQERL